jgi:hypothetical protein
MFFSAKKWLAHNQLDRERAVMDYEQALHTSEICAVMLCSTRPSFEFQACLAGWPAHMTRAC